MFTQLIMDNAEYNFACSVKRRAVIVSSDNSGILLDGSYYNDVMGTYMEYDVSLAIPAGQEDAYVAFYEAITNPIPYHDFVLPYNNEMTLVRGRVANISDTYMQKNALGKVTWRNITFTVAESIAHKPANGAYTPVVPPNPFITAENVDEELVFTIVDYDNIDFENVDETLQITYT